MKVELSLALLCVIIYLT